MKNKKSQVWIETVIYTLISLIIIGAVLAVIKPKLQEMQDKSIIEGTLEILENINSKIISATGDGVGNVRIAEFTLKKGNLIIDEKSDSISFILEDSGLTYSEPNQNKYIFVGNVGVKTNKVGKSNTIILNINHSSKSDLEYTGPQVLGKTATAYKLSIENQGVKDPTWTQDTQCTSSTIGNSCSDENPSNPYTLDTCEEESSSIYKCRHQDPRPQIQITLQ